MKYAGMPWGMWVLFVPSFKKHLTESLGYSKKEAVSITAKAKPRCRQIIARLPEFEEDDSFLMNIQKTEKGFKLK